MVLLTPVLPDHTVAELSDSTSLVTEDDIVDDAVVLAPEQRQRIDQPAGVDANSQAVVDGIRAVPQPGTRRPGAPPRPQRAAPTPCRSDRTTRPALAAHRQQLRHRAAPRRSHCRRVHDVHQSADHRSDAVGGVQRAIPTTVSIPATAAAAGSGMRPPGLRTRDHGADRGPATDAWSQSHMLSMTWVSRTPSAMAWWKRQTTALPIVPSSSSTRSTTKIDPQRPVPRQRLRPLLGHESLQRGEVGRARAVGLA